MIRALAGAATFGLSVGAALSIPDCYTFVIILYVLTAYFWEPLWNPSTSR